MRTKPAVLPYLLIAASGVLWGLTFSLAKIARMANAHPLGLTLWQSLGGAVFLLCICVVRRTGPPLDKDHLKRYTIIALLGTAVPGTLNFYAASKVPAGLLAITVALVPLLTYGLSWLIGADRFALRRFYGIALGFAAIVLLIAPDTSLPDPAMVKWLLLAVFASVFYTLENLYVDLRVPNHTDMVILLMGALVVSSVILAPVVAVTGTFVPLAMPPGPAEWPIIGMILASNAAYLMFLYVIKSSGAVFASITGYIITLCGVLWGILLFGERHSLWVWAALILMLAGMALVTPRQRMAAVSNPT